jgi:hypothetical protein
MKDLEWVVGGSRLGPLGLRGGIGCACDEQFQAVLAFGCLGGWVSELAANVVSEANYVGRGRRRTVGMSSVVVAVAVGNGGPIEESETVLA